MGRFWKYPWKFPGIPGKYCRQHSLGGAIITLTYVVLTVRESKNTLEGKNKHINEKPNNFQFIDLELVKS